LKDFIDRDESFFGNCQLVVATSQVVGISGQRDVFFRILFQTIGVLPELFF